MKIIRLELETQLRPAAFPSFPAPDYRYKVLVLADAAAAQLAREWKGLGATVALAVLLGRREPACGAGNGNGLIHHHRRHF